MAAKSICTPLAMDRRKASRGHPHHTADTKYSANTCNTQKPSLKHADQHPTHDDHTPVICSTHAEHHDAPTEHKAVDEQLGTDPAQGQRRGHLEVGVGYENFRLFDMSTLPLAIGRVHLVHRRVLLSIVRHGSSFRIFFRHFGTKRALSYGHWMYSLSYPSDGGARISNRSLQSGQAHTRRLQFLRQAVSAIAGLVLMKHA
ncbi:hypothetical protein BKA56DRAFT_717935 [Ilyonectria sp. MPI-CAGE-AT-0026]|nr:hypothetical protein BKA56DRAFT_717935 [Ilyonectria sp. MPI-CAGE-AT-0026]